MVRLGRMNRMVRMVRMVRMDRMDRMVRMVRMERMIRMVRMDRMVIRMIGISLCRKLALLMRSTGDCTAVLFVSSWKYNYS